MAILIVYFSISGSTKKIARSIVNSLACDIEEITESKNRKGFIGFMKSGFEAIFKKIPIIDASEKDPSVYDLIIIGTPTWVMNMSSPVRAYITQNAGNFKELAFFNTKGGSKDKVFEEMKEICMKEPIATLTITQKEINNEMFEEKINVFIDRINNRLTF